MKLLLFFCILFFVQVQDVLSQVRVRGYTRKDGTYVRPHTRSYPGSGSSASVDDNSNDDDSYGSKISATVDGKSLSVSKKKFKNDQYRVSHNLLLVQPRSYGNNAIPVYESDDLTLATSIEDTTTSPVYLSVIRVNGKVADIVAFSRDILYQKTDFSRPVYHTIKKSYFTAEQALELIDKYSFSSSEGVVKRMIDVGSPYSPPLELPAFITHKIQVIRLR